MLLSIPIFAKTVTLAPHYCVKKNLDLKADFFGVNENFEIIKIPKVRSTHTIPSLDVKKIFIKNGYEVIDSPTSLITFERSCNLAGKETELAETLLKKFEEKYPCLDADLPKIKTISPLPYDFDEYILIDVKIRDTAFKKRDGTFKALFKTPNNEKTVYFKYIIDGSIDVFKARHKLYNDKILSSSDYEKVQVKIDNLPSNVIACKIAKNLMTKNYVSADSILSMNNFEYKKDVLNGAHIRAYVRDGMLVIAIPATVLKDANIGDVVKIKTENAKVFNAKLVSKYKAIILE